MQIAFPYVFDIHQATGLADERAHIRQMLEQLLFTMPGERVNRPDYGCAVQRMVFAPANSEVVATLQTLIESEIHRRLGDVLTLRRLEVSASDGVLEVLIEYRLPLDDAPWSERFVRTP